MELPDYKILLTRQVPEMQGLWDGDFWRQTQPLSISCFRPEGSDHRPQTLCKLLYNQQNIFGIFRVEDQYVRSVHTGFQDDVWKDSCVEFFVQPKEYGGYFNFEFNCGGALLASHVTNPARVDGRLNEFQPLQSSDDRQIRRFFTLARVVEPEIPTPIIWYLEFSVPFAVLEKYAGSLGAVKGQTWRANFYKCGNETSHPHWVSWSPLSARNFHDPASFGLLEFCC
ncbi:MAG: carbohydrate-binding family 9-like protein [Smithellaceae bacterium]